MSVHPGPSSGVDLTLRLGAAQVAIARASAAGIRDFLVVPHSHPFIMRAAAVHRQIFHFLALGRFEGTPPGNPR